MTKEDTKLYSLVIHDDAERLTVEGKTVTVPLFYAASTAIEFLSHLDRPWKTDPEDGADLCSMDWERRAFDLEEAQRALLSDEGLCVSMNGVRIDVAAGESEADVQVDVTDGPENPILEEKEPIQDGILMGWN